MQLITGNTYPVKESIKALGGTWNKPQQGWMVPDENAEQARALVATAPAQERQPANSARRSRYRSTVTRFSSGAEIYRNSRGRCEDAPCCGCCS